MAAVFVEFSQLYTTCDVWSVFISPVKTVFSWHANHTASTVAQIELYVIHRAGKPYRHVSVS